MIFQWVFLIIPDIIFTRKGNFARGYFNNVIDGNLDYLFTFILLHIDIYTENSVA